MTILMACKKTTCTVLREDNHLKIPEGRVSGFRCQVSGNRH